MKKRTLTDRLPDCLLITFFSLFLCTYTAILIYRNMEARVRVPLADSTLSWLLHSPFILLGICLLFVFLWFQGWAFLNGHDAPLIFLYKQKLPLTILFVLFWLLFDLNCTSLYHWTYYLEGAKEQAPLWGISQPFRSDEWAVWSPFAFAQQYEGFPAVSTLISGGNIDASWISVGGIPAWNTVVLFKPLYWAFLLFGLETGFSFLSVARVVLLFWVSFAFALVYTRQNRLLSLTAAIALTLSPYIQWWYSQSIAEVFIYAQGMLLSGYYYLKADKPCHKMICSILFSYLLGCYIMIAYPGWLICISYLVMALGIWGGFYHNRKALVLRKDILAVIPVLAVLGLIIYNAFLTKDTLLAISGSVYPGSRVHTGEFVSWDFYTGLFSVLFPLDYPAPFSNVCDSSNILSFSPAGLVLAVCSWIRQKKSDSVILVLIGVESFFAAFMLLGVSPGIAQLTLLSQCTRLQPVIAFIDMILLYRHLAGGYVQFSAPGAILLTIASALLIWIPGARRFQYSKGLTVLIFLLGWIIFYLIYRRDPNKQKSTRRMCYAIICCAVLAGGFINPIQKGISCVTELDLVQQLNEIQDQDALYIMEGYFPHTNAPLLAGKRSYTTTTAYPNPEKWEVLDPDGIYRDIYNRFCHVSMSLRHEETSFELIALDQIKLNLSFRDLRKLNIDYLITRKDYSNEQFEDMQLILTGRTETLNIYHILYR